MKILQRTFSPYGCDFEPLTPEQLSLPKLEIDSLGKYMYAPRFTVCNNKAIIQFGHYFGCGSYYVETIENHKNGLNLYGADNSGDSTISEKEMGKLNNWLNENKVQLIKKLQILSLATK